MSIKSDKNAKSTSSITSESVLLANESTNRHENERDSNDLRHNDVDAKIEHAERHTTPVSMNSSSISTEPLLCSMSNTPLLISDSNTAQVVENNNEEVSAKKENFLDLNDSNNLTSSSTSSSSSQTKKSLLLNTTRKQPRPSQLNQTDDTQSRASSFKSHYSLKNSFNKDTCTVGGCTTSSGGGIESINLSIGKRLAMLQPDMVIANSQIVNTHVTANNTTNSLNSVSMMSLNNISTNTAENNANGNAYVNGNSYLSGIIAKDPVLIRGAGNITIFGVSNRFSEQFPTQLNAKLAPEEFKDTIKQINNILNKELANSLKWLVFGSIFCCCTLGCSLLPVIFMNKKARLSINKLLEMENQRLYLKLGLKWRLAKIKCNSNALLEYVLLIEFLPTILLYQPD